MKVQQIPKKRENILKFQDVLKEKLKEEGYEEKLISYEELQELHKKYISEIEEKVFAIEVLRITYDNYMSMKNKRTRGKILKKDDGISKEKIEEIKEIKEKLKEEGYERKLISYEELQALHKRFAIETEEKIFTIEVLGITHANYNKMKNRGTRGGVRDKNLVIKSNYIKGNVLKETRYYTKEEIEEMCEINNITIEEFIEYIVLDFYVRNIEEAKYEYQECILQKDRLWIGKTNLSNEFAEQNIEKIYEIARIVVNTYYKRYGILSVYKEDYVQYMIIYILKTCGDIEKNFGDNEKLINRMIYGKMKWYLLRKVIEENKLKKREIGLTKRYSKSEKEYEYLTYEEIDVEQEVEDFELGETCIERLKELVEEGYNKKKALEIIAEELGLSKQELIEIMTYYINKREKVIIKRNRKSKNPQESHREFDD